MTTASNIRYFYTDPLAAAWMQKHFGMRFEDDILQQSKDSELLSAVSSLAVGEAVKYLSKIYIHPDSVSLLEPMEWDVGVDCRHGGGYMGYMDLLKFRSPYWVYEINGNNIGEKIKKVKIIQRHGGVFIYPESEPMHLSREE